MNTCLGWYLRLLNKPPIKHSVGKRYLASKLVRCSMQTCLLISLQFRQFRCRCGPLRVDSLLRLLWYDGVGAMQSCKWCIFGLYSFCLMYHINFDHNSNQLKPTLGKRDKLKYTDRLSAEMKPQQKRFNYFPKLNSVVKYANTTK